MKINDTVIIKLRIMKRSSKAFCKPVDLFHNSTIPNMITEYIIVKYRLNKYEDGLKKKIRTTFFKREIVKGKKVRSMIILLEKFQIHILLPETLKFTNDTANCYV